MFNPFNKKQKSSVEIVLKKKIECLILIGDCTVDNFAGLTEHNKDIEYQIVETLTKCKKGKENSKKKGGGDDDDEAKQPDIDVNNNTVIRIHNLSLCNMDVEGILNGHAPLDEHVKARKEHKLAAYPLDKDNKLYPIKLLSSMLMNHEIKIIQKNKDKNHINPTVILSAGFTDLRNNLKYGKPELITEALRKQEFAEKYEKIVHQMVDNLGLNLIIVIPYEPHESFAEEELHFSRDDLLACMEYVGGKMLLIAEKFKCPVVDLSRTFNPFNREHYAAGKVIEPSYVAGQFFVDLVMKIVASWDWNDDKKTSKIYYGIKQIDGVDSNEREGVHVIDNDKSYRQSYFNILQSRALLLNTATQNNDEMDLLADLFQDEQ